jgi:hypothetical protein
VAEASRLIEWIDRVIGLGSRAATWTDHNDRIDHAKWEPFRAAALSFVSKVFDESHPHYVALTSQLELNFKDRCEAATGILEVMRDEIKAGWHLPLRELLTAELFSDFLESRFLNLG